MKKICVVISSRANYSSLKSVLEQVSLSKKLKLQLVVGASALIDRFGSVEKVIQKDGFKIDFKVHMLLEGENVETMAKTTGLGLLELPTIFKHLKPDIVLIVGDRYENLATAISSSYMNIIIGHTMGGEVSGTIDESIRHAITKLAHIHFPASIDSKKRIIKLGENKKNVFHVGCPRIDLTKRILESKKFKCDNKSLHLGVGDKIDLNKPFIIVSQHPVTTEYDMASKQIDETIKSLLKIDCQKIFLWPNSDAGSNVISQRIRAWRERKELNKIRFYKSFPPETYMYLMSKAKCLIGNSSSGIREGAYMGTPVVNIGSRQNGREREKNVIDVGHNSKEIVAAVKKQIKHGKYKKSKVYGDGNAGKRIAKILEKVKVNIQKKISY